MPDTVVQKWLWLVSVIAVLYSPLERDKYVLRSSENRGVYDVIEVRAKNAMHRRNTKCLKGCLLSQGPTDSTEEEKGPSVCVWECPHMCACAYVCTHGCVVVYDSWVNLGLDYLRLYVDFSVFTFPFLSIVFLLIFYFLKNANLVLAILTGKEICLSTPMPRDLENPECSKSQSCWGNKELICPLEQGT